ncbi:predicted protein [Nematostella vectensis]|uniref:G-protein coupled receptors family 1 profile domain-containing protein n=2 Tax=Nematostella vectensis TaxID=45351 RepID=A7RJE9_NEMVE|nr:predicted protein [Nematostella vectensis]|eukprot:XP_001640314.1 predicted protein [Nematostella vectensis]
MSSATNYFIFNLAISDLGILLISLPAYIIRDYFSWSFGKIACQIIIPMNDVSFSVSICTITVITLERYRAIVAPFKPRLKARGGKLTIALIWVLTYLSVGFPMAFYMELTKVDDRLICLPKWPSNIVFKILTCFFISLIIIPLCITAVAYIIMIKTMRKQSKRLREARERRHSAGIGSTVSLKHVQERHRHDYNAKLVKMLIIIVVVFWICMLPLSILAFVVEFFVIDPRKPVVDGLFTLSIAVFFSNSAFNPVAIYIMSSDLRKGINTLLFFGRKRCKKNGIPHI